MKKFPKLSLKKFQLKTAVLHNSLNLLWQGELCQNRRAKKQSTCHNKKTQRRPWTFISILLGLITNRCKMLLKQFYGPYAIYTWVYVVLLIHFTLHNFSITCNSNFALICKAHPADLPSTLLYKLRPYCSQQNLKKLLKPKHLKQR